MNDSDPTLAGAGRFSLRNSRALRWSVGVGLAVMVGIGLVGLALEWALGRLYNRLLRWQ